jgi:hypothetical protein
MLLFLLLLLLLLTLRVHVDGSWREETDDDEKDFDMVAAP